MFGVATRTVPSRTALIPRLRNLFSSTSTLLAFNQNRDQNIDPPADPLSGEKRIWENYKRNHKGSIPPQKTRLRCKRIAGRRQIVSNPCPICRHDIEVNYTNVKLLEQFICSHTGAILPASKTGVCRLEQKKLVAAIEEAWDHGLIPFTIPQEVILPKDFDPRQKPVLPTWNKIEVLEKGNKKN